MKVFAEIILAWLSINLSLVWGQSSIELLQLAAEAGNQKSNLGFEIRFSAEILTPELDAEGLARIQKRQAETLQVVMERYKDQPGIRKQYADLLAKNDEIVAAQAQEYRNIKLQGMHRTFGPLFGGDRLTEVKMRKGNDPPNDFQLLQRFLDENEVRSVFFDIRSRLTTVGTTPSRFGIPDLLSLGHLSGPVLVALPHPEAFFCEIDPTWQAASSGEVCVKFKMQSASRENDLSNEQLTIVGRAVVDSSRNHVCTYFEWGFDGQIPVLTVASSDFFKAEGTNIWFPGSCEVRTKKVDGVHVAKISMRPDEIVGFKRLSSELFSISIPSGTTLVYQLGNPQQRKALCEVSIDIDGLDKLLDNKCLQGGGEPNVPHNFAMLYLTIGFTLTLGGLYYGKRRWKKA